MRRQAHGTALKDREGVARQRAKPLCTKSCARADQTRPLTGSNAAFGKDIRDGALAWFKSVNARGGVGGKPIELVTLDDANDRKTAGANTQKLLTANGAVALFGYASATLSLDADGTPISVGRSRHSSWGATNVPRPCTTRRTPRSLSERTASRMVGRLTSSSAARSASGGSALPAGNSPSTTRSKMP